MLMTARARLILASAALVTSVTVGAHAGNDDGVLLGEQAMITGGAVTAIVADGASAWYNPAGLGQSSRNRFDVTGSVYGVNIYRVKSAFALPDGTTANAAMTDWVLVPSVLSFVRELGNDWVATVGIFIPRTHDFDLRTQVHKETGEIFAGTISSQLRENDYMMAVAKRLGPNLRLGVSAAGVYISRRDFVQIGFGSPDAPDAGFYNGSSSTTVSNYGVRLTLGMQWNPAPDWDLGLSIQSPVLTGWSDISRTVLQSTLSPDTGPHFSVDEQLGAVAGLGLHDTRASARRCRAPHGQDAAAARRRHLQPDPHAVRVAAQHFFRSRVGRQRPHRCAAYFFAKRDRWSGRVHGSERREAVRNQLRGHRIRLEAEPGALRGRQEA